MKLSPPVFFEVYAPIAVNDSLFTRIPPSIKLAQAALESGWGGSGLTINANNFFGIKSHGWGGATYDSKTHEYYGGSSSPTTVDAEWRVYGSPYESFMDHSKFIMKYDRYKSLFALDPQDYRGWAVGLQNAGYATSPTYAQKLINIVEKYDLTKYDRKAARQRFLKGAAWTVFALVAAYVVYLLIKRLF